jgi:thiol-disulfide isomerase/thioredoxin
MSFVVWILFGALFAILGILVLNKQAPPNLPPPSLPFVPIQTQQVPPQFPQKPASIPNKVVTLTSAQEVKDFLVQGGLVMVFAEWCGHCKNMMPALEEASNAAGTRIGKFDGTKDQKFMQEQAIRGFPTILLKGTGEGEFPKYSGQRDTNSLIAASRV